MAVDSSSRPTYGDVINALRSNLQDPVIDAKIADDTLILWILQACQQITQKVRLTEKRELLLIQSQTDYLFDNVTEPVNGTGMISSTATAVTGASVAGTGTISSSSTGITGVGTAFISELAIGKAIIVGSEIKEVMSVDSNTSCTVKTQFNSNLAATTFSISATKFTRELVVGSVIVSSGQSRTISVVTDPMTATVSTPFSPDIAAQAFTVDTSVQKIPTRFHRISRIERTQSGISRDVGMVGMENVTDLAVNDGRPFYNTFDLPLDAAEWRDSSGRRYLRFYAPPDDHKQVTIYGDILIQPRYYSSVTKENMDTTAIPLYEDHEPMIRNWVTAQMYLSYMNDFAMYRAFMDAFDKSVADFTLNLPNVSRTRMVYF